ncbi:MAG: hypothetical protein EHM55_16320 [Acidobacteria bacterium]|nr:MAG: hypothetical protein EHM55_16320 [Acidobacteriota bacterium]
MRFMIMHKTNAHWEAGAIPSPELIARVGKLIGELAKANVLLGAEGLRASSEGVRLTFTGGTRTISKGPFTGTNELPSGFSLLRVESLDEAIAWATRQAKVLGDVEIDIRPVTEPWDIGMTPRPAHVATRRYMALRKATPASEAGVPLTPAQQAEMSRLIDEAERTGVHLATERMRPSARGRRYKNSRDGVTVTDGPFTESKELIAGYVIVSAPSLEEADRWAAQYIGAVDAHEVDLRELEDGK